MSVIKSSQLHEHEQLTSSEYFQRQNLKVSRSMGLDRFRSAREQIEKMPSKMEMNPNQYRQKECIQKIGQFTKGLITQKDLINSLKTLNGYEPGIHKVVARE